MGSCWHQSFTVSDGTAKSCVFPKHLSHKATEGTHEKSEHVMREGQVLGNFHKAVVTCTVQVTLDKEEIMCCRCIHGATTTGYECAFDLPPMLFLPNQTGLFLVGMAK